MDKHSNKVTFCKLSRFFRILFIDFSGFYSSIFPVFIHRNFRLKKMQRLHKSCKEYNSSCLNYS